MHTLDLDVARRDGAATELEHRGVIADPDRDSRARRRDQSREALDQSKLPKIADPSHALRAVSARARHPRTP